MTRNGDAGAKCRCSASGGLAICTDPNFGHVRNIMECPVLSPNWSFWRKSYVWATCVEGLWNWLQGLGLAQPNALSASVSFWILVNYWSFLPQTPSHRHSRLKRTILSQQPAVLPPYPRGRVMEPIQLTDIHLTSPEQIIGERDQKGSFQKAMDHILANHPGAEPIQSYTVSKLLIGEAGRSKFRAAFVIAICSGISSRPCWRAALLKGFLRIKPSVSMPRLSKRMRSDWIRSKL